MFFLRRRLNAKNTSSEKTRVYNVYVKLEINFKAALPNFATVSYT